MSGEWDVSLSRTTHKDGGLQLAIPAPVARALREKGYNRAKLRLVDEGLLFTPYVADQKPAVRRATAELPDTWQ